MSVVGPEADKMKCLSEVCNGPEADLADAMVVLMALLGYTPPSVSF